MGNCSNSVALSHTRLALVEMCRAASNTCKCIPCSRARVCSCFFVYFYTPCRSSTSSNAPAFCQWNGGVGRGRFALLADDDPRVAQNVQERQSEQTNNEQINMCRLCKQQRPYGSIDARVQHLLTNKCFPPPPSISFLPYNTFFLSLASIVYRTGRFPFFRPEPAGCISSIEKW